MVRRQLGKTGMTLVCSRCFMLPAKVPSWAGKGGCSKLEGKFTVLSQRERAGDLAGFMQLQGSDAGSHSFMEVSFHLLNLISTAARLTSLLRYTDVNHHTSQQPEVACKVSQII